MTNIDIAYNIFTNHKFIQLGKFEVIPEAFRFYQVNPDNYKRFFELLDGLDLKEFLNFCVDNFTKKELELIRKELLTFYEIVYDTI
jgi:hypothetical protein